MATVKTFLVGVAKVAAAIVAAVLVLALIGYGVSEVRDGWRKRDALPYETVKTWNTALHESLGMKLRARSKLVNGTLYLAVSLDGYPRYLSDPAMRSTNDERHLTIQFHDGDGFKVYERPIRIKEFTTIVGADSKPAGLMYETTQALSVEDYKRWHSARVEWNLETDVASAAKWEDAPEQKPKLDHCEPGISKAERLKRLAQYGNVRQVGGDRYEGGDRSVAFHYDGTVLSCN